MHYVYIRNDLYRILREANGRYRTAYQICRRIQQTNPTLWTKLTREYPSTPGQPHYGAGAGIYYSPASLVAHALNYFWDRDNHPHIKKEWFDSTNITFENVEPGFKGGWISIWAWDDN